MVVKILSPTKDFRVGQLVSRLKSKLRCAISTLQELLFSNVDIAGIYNAIKSNKGSRYYNISTDSLVKRMTNVSYKYQVRTL